MKWNGLNWNWLRSIIDEYVNGKISREKFIADWCNAQETMRTVQRVI